MLKFSASAIVKHEYTKFNICREAGREGKKSPVVETGAKTS
jgi:hypothetical protein